MHQMTDVMPEQQAVDLDEPAGDELAGADVLDAVDEQLIARLAGRARAGGLALTGESVWVPRILSSHATARISG
jgi:putative transposase